MFQGRRIVSPSPLSRPAAAAAAEMVSLNSAAHKSKDKLEKISKEKETDGRTDILTKTMP